MSQSSLIISDFRSAVLEKDQLFDSCCRDLWEVQPYETAKIKGQALIASPNTLPKPITVVPSLTGWYNIYVCILSTSHVCSENRIELKLTDDEFPRTLGPNRVLPHIQWAAFEKVEEAYWKSADMTGQTITISKVDDGTAHTASLFWLRFEAMNDEEVAAYQNRITDPSRKTMLAHMDGDFMYMDDPKTPHDYCRQIYHMKDSDVGIISQEIMNDLVEFEKLDLSVSLGRSAWTPRRIENHAKFHLQRKDIYKEEIAWAHKYGMEFFGAQRMALSNFSFPYADVWNYVPFIAEHPEFYCKARNGKTVTFLSYAYKEVQDFIIESFLNAARYGFDGITLLFTRGVCVLFEQPVIDRYKAKYGDSVDFCRIPEKDPRVEEIRSDVMTEFMQRLRQALNNYAEDNNRKPLKIYVASYFSAAESKTAGIDVERFAREGLIDGMIQSNMTVWEETDDVLDEDGLINLEKYTKKAETEYVIRRSHGNEIKRTLAGLPEYNRIASEYGIKLYSEIQWENSAEPEEFLAYAKQIYETSVGSIGLWDCYPGRVSRPAEWNCVSQLGSREHTNALSDDPKAYRTLHKILSYGEHDMSLYQANWRG